MEHLKVKEQVVIEDWPVKTTDPQLPAKAQEAIQLLRENPNGYTEYYGSYTGENDSKRCAIGLLAGENIYSWLRDGSFSKKLIERFGFSDDGFDRIPDIFDDGENKSFQKMADIMENHPEEFFNL